MFYKREQYLNHLMELKNKTDLIKLVMGVRGAGKSTLFTLLQDELLKKGIKKEDIIHIDLDEEKYSSLAVSSDLLNEIEKESKNNENIKYLLIDEIQYIKHYETALDKLMQSNKYSIYLSSSNRYICSEVFDRLFCAKVEYIFLSPLSLKEFMEVKDLKDINKAFYDYLMESGFPFTLTINDLNQKVKTIRNHIITIYERDVFTHEVIENNVLFKKFMIYIFNNFAKEISVNNIAYDVFGDNSKSSLRLVDNYINILKNVFLINVEKNNDENELAEKCYKFYLMDMGLYFAFIENKTIDYVRVLENIIYNANKYNQKIGDLINDLKENLK